MTRKSYRFAELIRAKLSALELGVVEFAEEIGCTSEHARKIFNGSTFPSKHLEQIIAEKLKIDPKALESQIEQDRWVAKYGELPVDKQGTFFPQWDLLTPEQKKFVSCVAECLLRANISA